MEKRYDFAEVTSIAASLYEGGWRAEDKEALMQEYEMSEENAEIICEQLREYED